MGRAYENVFRTLPDPSESLSGPICFAVIGDFGAGLRKPGSKQKEIAVALETVARERDVRFIVTTGDNIYAQRKIGPLPIGGQGDEDDDWFFTFHQPYRYLINRMPVYPSIGNDDTGESEEQDDRGQLDDNLYIRERIAPDLAAGRASLGSGLFYRFRVGADVELIALDTSKDGILSEDRLFLHPNHRQFLDQAFPRTDGKPMWRIPLGTIRPSARVPSTRTLVTSARRLISPWQGRVTLLELFQRAGVRVALSGHEQLPVRAGARDVIRGHGRGCQGAARQAQGQRHGPGANDGLGPGVSFLLVTIHGKKMTLEPIAAFEGGNTGSSTPSIPLAPLSECPSR